MNFFDKTTIFDELTERCENAMPYVQHLTEKYISYEIAYNITELLFILMMISICGFVLVRFSPRVKETDWDRGDDVCITMANVARSIALVVLCIVFFIQLGENGKNILECLTFPEKVIFDYLKSAN